MYGGAETLASVSTLTVTDRIRGRAYALDFRIQLVLVIDPVKTVFERAIWRYGLNICQGESTTAAIVI